MKNRVYITGFCNTDDGIDSLMSVEDFETLCQFLRGNPYNRSYSKEISLLGREILNHPNFIEIVNIAQSYFTRVNLFIDKINLAILQRVSPRDQDKIIYNFNSQETLSKEALLVDKPGSRHIRVLFQPSMNVEETLESLRNIQKLWTSDSRLLKIRLALDCTAGISSYRDKLTENYMLFSRGCTLSDLDILREDFAPVCFPLGGTPEEDLCSPRDGGLIDPSFNLRFCDQYREPLLNIKTEEGFVSYDLIARTLRQKFDELQGSVSSKCSGCSNYPERCNGGCWVPKEFITEEDLEKKL